MSEREIELAVGSSAGRLDGTLAQQLPGHSRSALQRLIRRGRVRVNGAVVRRASTPVSSGDRILIDLDQAPPGTPLAEQIPLEILFEDEHLLVVDKPPGMVVHPAPGHEAGTLVNALLAQYPALPGGQQGRPGIVHRLDKDTSGLIVVAKTAEALAGLQRQFKDRQVTKRYLGLVDGAPPTPEGEVQASIGRDPRHRQRFAVLRSKTARPAVTRYRTRDAFPRHSLLELRPVTGRTHQIRIHMKALKCPVVGDRVYGRRRPSLPVGRQMLHAWQLELALPGSGDSRRFEAPIPADLGRAIELARKA